MMVIKKPALDKVNVVLKAFSKAVQDNCSTYTFYRGKLYCNESGHVCIDFLASDIKGAFKKPCLEYNTEEGIIYYDREGSLIRFSNEDEVKKSIYKLVSCFINLFGSVDRVLFDFCTFGEVIQKGVVRDCPYKGHEDEIMLYLMSGNNVENKYNYTDAIDKYGLELCSSWLTEAKNGFVNFKEAGC